MTTKQKLAALPRVVGQRSVFSEEVLATTTPADQVRAALRPSLNGALTIEQLSPFRGALDLRELTEALSTEARNVIGGNLTRMEATLAVQVHTLDAMFSALVSRAVGNITAAEGPFTETADLYMRLALKAQSQCRATVETLAVMKNPPQVAFVRQANIAAGPQQVNNGVPAPAREKSESTPTKLLEAKHGERVDSGAPSAATETDKAMATLAAIDGPANGGRKGPRSQKRIQGRHSPNAARTARGAPGPGPSDEGPAIENESPGSAAKPFASIG